MELILRSAGTLALFAALALPAYSIAQLITANKPVLTRWLAVVAAWLTTSTVLFHVFIAVGLFKLTPTLLLLGALSVACVVSPRQRAALREAVRKDSIFIRRVARLRKHSRFRIRAALVLLLVWPALVRTLVVPPLTWDALTYHTLKAGLWVHHGHIDDLNGPGPWAYSRTIFSGGEVFQAWAGLGLHSDALISAVDAFQFVLLGLVLVILGRRMQIREPYSTTAAAYVLALPALRLLVGSSYVEIGLLLALASGLGLAFDRSLRGTNASVLAAGAFGVAAATKLPALILAGVATMMLIATLCVDRSYRRAVAALLAFSISVAPWLVSATIRTGAPLSPMPVHVGSVALGVTPPEMEWYMSRPGLHPYTIDSELAALTRVFSLPLDRSPVIGFVALAPMFAAVLGAFTIYRRSRYQAVVVAVLWLVSLALYYAPDFSVVRHFWSASSSRFLLPAMMLMSLVAFAACRPAARWSSWYLNLTFGVIVYNLLITSFVGFSSHSLVAIVVVTFVGVCTTFFLARQRARVRLVAAAMAAVTAIAALQMYRDHLRAEVLRSEFVHHALPKYFESAIEAIDQVGVNYRIAVTSGPAQNLDNWFAAPFLGRRFQNDIVYEPVTRDGSVIHFGRFANDSFAAHADFDAWRQRLRRDGVTRVMSFTPPSVELQWMESRPSAFRRLAGRSGAWGLYAVEP
jgi:hypothetical protein